METLAKLFGDGDRLKVLRLFLFNPATAYDIGEVARRTGIRDDKARKIAGALASAGAIRAKRLPKKDKKGQGYILDPRFPYAQALTDLVMAASLRADRGLAARIASAGKIRLVIASGIFVREPEARLDLLIAGDDVSEARLARVISALESDIGRDLSYSCLPTAEFEYRLAMHDRLIRDVVDFPHAVLIDRIGFGAKKANK